MPLCPVSSCKKQDHRHWLRDCPTNPSVEEQKKLLDELEKRRHDRREVKRLKKINRCKRIVKPVENMCGRSKQLAQAVYSPSVKFVIAGLQLL